MSPTDLGGADQAVRLLLNKNRPCSFQMSFTLQVTVTFIDGPATPNIVGFQIIFLNAL